MNNGRTMARAENLSYSVGDIHILKAVSFEVGAGEFVGVIGPNGAGKTTLLKLILGILDASSGTITLGGRPIKTLKPRERARIAAYLSQDVNATFPYPVLDVVMMGRYPHVKRLGPEREHDIEIARRALAYVGLEGFEDRYINELSGGERQLVLFAKVLAQESRLLVLDEPTSNLDIKHQDEFFSMAAELVAEGKAVVAAVHNLDVASQYCSRLVLLDRGRVAANGVPPEVLRSEILDPVYHADTVVTHNVSTGGLVVNVIPTRRQGEGPRVHLIGGAGSAINLTRELSRRGYRVTGGIAHDYDTDAQLWRSIGVEFECVGAFHRIDETTVQKATRLVADADLTILCDFPFGPGNKGNLDLAGRAKDLVVVRSEEETRSFFDPESKRLFHALETRARSMAYSQLIQAMENGQLVRR